MTTATLFRTGSIAKPMTSTTAMALYQAGRLDLDAPVQKYCPVFPKKQWTITTRELLGHLSGIRHYKQDNSDVFSTKRYAHISDAFEMFANDPLLFDPGAIRVKLGGSANLNEPFPWKPKGMRWSTYQRLRRQAGQAESRSWPNWVYELLGGQETRCH